MPQCLVMVSGGGKGADELVGTTVRVGNVRVIEGGGQANLSQLAACLDLRRGEGGRHFPIR